MPGIFVHRALAPSLARMTDRYYHGGLQEPATDGGKGGMVWVRRGMGTRARSPICLYRTPSQVDDVGPGTVNRDHESTKEARTRAN